MKAVLDAETLRKAISNIENALSEKDKALKHRAEEMDSIRGMLHDKEREVENLTSDISRLDGEKIRLSDELTLRERRIKLLAGREKRLLPSCMTRFQSDSEQSTDFSIAIFRPGALIPRQRP